MKIEKDKIKEKSKEKKERKKKLNRKIFNLPQNRLNKKEQKCLKKIIFLTKVFIHHSENQIFTFIHRKTIGQTYQTDQTFQI